MILGKALFSLALLSLRAEAQQSSCPPLPSLIDADFNNRFTVTIYNRAHVPVVVTEEPFRGGQAHTYTLYPRSGPKMPGAGYLRMHSFLGVAKARYKVGIPDSSVTDAYISVLNGRVDSASEALKESLSAYQEWADGAAERAASADAEQKERLRGYSSLAADSENEKEKARQRALANADEVWNGEPYECDDSILLSECEDFEVDGRCCRRIEYGALADLGGTLGLLGLIGELFGSSDEKNEEATKKEEAVAKGLVRAIGEARVALTDATAFLELALCDLQAETQTYEGPPGLGRRPREPMPYFGLSGTLTLVDTPSLDWRQKAFFAPRSTSVELQIPLTPVWSWSRWSPARSDLDEMWLSRLYGAVGWENNIKAIDLGGLGIDGSPGQESDPFNQVALRYSRLRAGVNLRVQRGYFAFLSFGGGAALPVGNRLVGNPGWGSERTILAEDALETATSRVQWYVTRVRSGNRNPAFPDPSRPEPPTITNANPNRPNQPNPGKKQRSGATHRNG